MNNTHNYKIPCKIRLLSILLIVGIMVGTLSISAFADDQDLTEDQNNAITMLNYLTVLTQEINSSKNSRIYLEEAYSDLINYSNPNAIDNRTLAQYTNLLDIMESYRMINVKRERLQYIYEQNQAQAIRAAMPSPLGLLSAVQSFRPSKIISSVLYMAVDSVSSYTAYKKSTDLQYMKDGWALDDEESSELHNSRKNAFSYMVEIVNEYDLPGNLALNEKAVEEFVKWKNSTNVGGRIQFLESESNKRTYKMFGGYWLELAKSYYENNQYSKCIDAIKEYENLDIKIFRQDYEYAKVLPMVICAADKIYTDTKYVSVASEYVKKILDNSDHDEWALRYFAAQIYIDLYAKTNNQNYLNEAYEVVKDNVNYLVDSQHQMNDEFLTEISEIKIPKDASKDQKNEIKKLNKMLKETREIELAPISEPLRLNCELLIGLADELNISSREKTKIDSFIHPNNEPLFLNDSIDSMYWFSSTESKKPSTDIEFLGDMLIVPAMSVNEDVIINVKVKEKSTGKETSFSDWEIKKVERVNKEDVSSFQAAYSSKKASKYEWQPGEEISVEIIPSASINLDSFSSKYESIGTKNNWYDYLKIWEGQKNNWYDYLRVWDNSVVFKRIN